MKIDEFEIEEEEEIHSHRSRYMVLWPEVINDSPSIINLSCNQSIQIKTIKWAYRIVGSARVAVVNYSHRHLLFTWTIFVALLVLLFVVCYFCKIATTIIVHLWRRTDAIIQCGQKTSDSYIYRIFWLIYLHFHWTVRINTIEMMCTPFGVQFILSDQLIKIMHVQTDGN